MEICLTFFHWIRSQLLHANDFLVKPVQAFGDAAGTKFLHRYSATSQSSFNDNAGNDVWACLQGDFLHQKRWQTSCRVSRKQSATFAQN